MIRIFLVFILFFSFSFSKSKCTGWVGKPPKGAYCWDISSIQKKNGYLNISVDVYGFPHNKPNVTFNKKYIKHIEKKDIKNRIGIVNIRRYFYKVKLEKKDLKGSWIKVKDHFRLKASKQLK